MGPPPNKKGNKGQICKKSSKITQITYNNNNFQRKKMAKKVNKGQLYSKSSKITQITYNINNFQRKK